MKRFVCLVGLVASLAALSGCGVTKEAYLAKGNAFFREGKYDDASLNYRKAIQKDLGFGEAYYRLGLLAVKSNQAQVAYNALREAMQLLPDKVEVKEHFADVCLSLYLADTTRPQALYNELNTLSTELLSKNGKSYQGLLVKAYLAATDGKFPQAIESFRKALEVNSSDAGVVAELARVLIQAGQVKAGEEVALDLITRQKTTYGPVYDLLFDFYRTAKRASEAENVLVLKVSNNPKHADYRLQLARYYSSLGNRVEMRATLERLLDDPANFPQARIQVGDFYLAQQDYTEAIRCYQDGLGANPDAKAKLAYQKRSVVALLGLGKRDDAQLLAEQVVKANPTDPGALHLHAGILLDSGKRENAAVAVHEFQTLVAQNRGDAGLLLDLGRAYRLQGDLSAARAQFQEAINLRKDLIAARYELAEVSLLEKHPAEAIQQANKILELREKNRRAELLRTAGWIATGKGEAARAELSQLAKESPRDLEPQLQLGLLAVAEKKYPEAINTLEPHRGSGDPRVFTGLAVSYLHQKEYGKAREVLNEGLKTQPDSPMLLEQLADTEALTGHYDLAIEYLQKLLSQDPKSVHLRMRLAEVYGLKGDGSRELALDREASAIAPNDLTAGMTLAGALAHAGHTGEARLQFQRVVNAHPESAPALNNTAFFLADTGGDLEEAMRLARRALEKIPEQPVFLDTVGYIYLKKGLSDRALETFSNLARKYPMYASFRYHLGLALFAKGESAAARKELQAALSEHPTPEDSQRIRELLGKLTSDRS